MLKFYGIHFIKMFIDVNLTLKNKIKNINNVFYTHAHADQTHGINEMRAFYIINRKELHLYVMSLIHI